MQHGDEALALARAPDLLCPLDQVPGFREQRRVVAACGRATLTARRRRSRRCARAECLGTRAPPAAPAPRGQRPPATRGDNAALLAEARQLLEGTQKIRRPRKRKGLIAVLHSHFSKKVPERELQGMVDELIARGELSESNGAITYLF